MATPKTKNAPGVPAPAGQALPTVPDDMLDITAQDARLGVSDDPADRLLRLITALNHNSTVVIPRSPDYQIGAEAGKLWVHNDLNPFRESLTAIPVDMWMGFIEWGPTRGSGGPYGRHPQLPSDTEVRKNPENNKRPLLVRRDSGNVLEEVREFYLLVDGEPSVLPFRGSGHSTAKRWQMHFRQLRHPRTGDILPCYAHKYQLTTKAQSNNFGSWYGVEWADHGPVSMPEYIAARELHAIIKRGAYRVEMPAAIET
jgi:hypothetical protein